MGKNLEGVSSIVDRYRIDRKVLEIVWEVEKPKNSHVQSKDMN